MQVTRFFILTLRLLAGRFLAELTKEVFSDLASSKYQVGFAVRRFIVTARI